MKTFVIILKCIKHSSKFSNFWTVENSYTSVQLIIQDKSYYNVCHYFVSVRKNFTTFLCIPVSNAFQMVLSKVSKYNLCQLFVIKIHENVNRKNKTRIADHYLNSRKIVLALKTVVVNRTIFKFSKVIDRDRINLDLKFGTNFN